MLTVESKEAPESELRESPTHDDKSMPEEVNDLPSPAAAGASETAGGEASSPQRVKCSAARDRNESTASDGMEHLSTKDLFRKRSAVCDDEEFVWPFGLLPGESLLYQGRTLTEQLVLLTTFRLFVASGRSFINIPLGVIEMAESVDVAKLLILCKNGQTECFTLANSEASFKWLARLKQELSPATQFTDLFAASFHAAVSQDEHWRGGTGSQYRLSAEIQRLGFRRSWKISTINEKYRCCTSYPKENLVPKDVDDEVLEAAARFRTQRRFPSAVWRNRENGSVLLRSSQPVVGVFCQRSKEDESLIQAIMRACNDSKDMTIVDCRSYTAAIANRAKGGGFEYSEYYANCDVQFMGLANIHAIRSSFAAVRTLISSNVPDASWYSQLDATRWMTNLSLLLEASRIVAGALDHRPVLVHCSDGWDRTPQIVSIAQLILDPHYRTFEGFQVLIEKEWLLFGHKFADRCGHAVDEADANEASPVFLQWLDAVYQLTRQFPTAFEFGEAYLRKLSQHVYSCLFGTFLCNNERERENLALYENTVSIWPYLHKEKERLANRFYSPSANKVLNVSSRVADLDFWIRAYASPTLSQAKSQCELSGAEEPSGLVRSQSYTNISTESGSQSGCRTSRRLSDPDLSGSASFSVGEAGSLNHSGSLLKLHSNSSINNVLTSSMQLGGSPVIVFNHARDAANPTSAAESSAPDTHGPSGREEGDKENAYNIYMDRDGLTSYADPVQSKVDDIVESYKRKIARLEKAVSQLQRSLAGGPACLTLSPDDAETEPGSAESGSGRSDSSWEEVDHRDTGLTLWIPDHAVQSCAACQTPFWVLRRKHRCRQCGQVFCQSCADAYVPIPEQQLHRPVRVCRSCHKALLSGERRDAEIDEADLVEAGVNSAHLDPDDGQVMDLVCSSSPRDIPPRKKTEPRYCNGGPAPGPAPVSSHPPAVLPTASADKTDNITSSHSSWNGSAYKTCSQESVNGDSSKLDSQHGMGPRAKC